MKTGRLWMWLGVIFLGIAAFLLLNFRLAITSNETQKLVMTTNMGADLPASMQRRDPISVVVVGKGSLDEALQKALAERLQEAGLGKSVAVQELKPSYDTPVLVVKVLEPGPLWTPLFALGQFSVHAGYDSGGDTTFMKSVEESHMIVAKPDAVNMYAEYDIRDRSMGLISRPGYNGYLADYLAQEIVTVLQGLYNP